MSKAGQNTNTGISMQADVALLYLLNNYQKSDFIKITLEGEKWDDFTLFFKDRTESYEVKWFKVLKQNQVKGILKKFSLKQSESSIKFYIVCKKLSPQFAKDYKFLKNSLFYWSQFNKGRSISDNPVVKSFLKKKWTFEEIYSLINTDIIELKTEESVQQNMIEHFNLVEDSYLDSSDLNSILSVSFKNVLKKSSSGSSISNTEFNDFLKQFIRKISEKSDLFTPEFNVGKKVKNVDDYLVSAEKFNELDHPKYLTPISKHRRLIFYILDKLEKNDFSFTQIKFFIEKILIKLSYRSSGIRLIKRLMELGRVGDDEAINFLNSYYKYITESLDVHDVLSIILQIAKHRKVETNRKILEFISANITGDKKTRYYGDSYSYEHLPEIIDEIGHTLTNEDEYLNVLFDQFAFTRDNYGLNETPSFFYGWIKNYILFDINSRLPKVLKLIAQQHKRAYNVLFKGYEFSGGGTEMHGYEFSTRDIGLVMATFRPLFQSIFEKSEDSFWKVIKRFVVKKNVTNLAASSPAFLKRAIVPCLIKTVLNKDSKYQKQSFNLLKQILTIKKGLPSTPEIIFYELRDVDLVKFGYDRVIELIKIDLVRYKKFQFLHNIFEIEVLLKLAAHDDVKAQQILSNSYKNAEFRKYMLFSDSLNLLDKPSLELKKSKFSLKLLKLINYPKYFENPNHDRLISSKFAAEVIEEHISSDPQTIGEFIDSILKSNDKAKDFLGNILSSINTQKADKIFDLIKTKINPGVFSEIFINADNFKMGLVQTAEQLVANKNFLGARQICDLVIDDPDPITSNEVSDFNYHLDVKNGKTQIIISTVRGRVCWLIQKFVGTNDPSLMSYSLASVKKLLDLDQSFAKKMNYPETNYYVLSQALVPLIELSHPARRKALEKYQKGLGDEVRKVATDVLQWTIQSAENGNKPKEIAHRLLYVFSYILDLNKLEADSFLNLLIKLEINESSTAFIYYAFYRKKRFKDSEFDETYFQNKLFKMCTENNSIRSNIAFQFWKMHIDDKWDDQLSEIEARKYWRQFVKNYEPHTYGYLKHILEERLENDLSYQDDKAILMEAIKSEMEFLKSNSGSYARFNFSKIGPVLLENSVQDFLSVVNLILKESNFSDGTTLYPYSMHEFIDLFKSIDQTSLTPIEQKSFNEVKKLFIDLGISI